MLRVHHILRHGVCPFHHSNTMWDNSNCHSSDPNEDGMQKAHPQEVYIPSYHFEVHKIVIISFSGVMFRVHLSESNSVCTFNHCVPWWYLSNGLLRAPNIDHMQKIHPREVDIPLYHLRVHNTICVSSSRVIFMLHSSWRHYLGPYYYFTHCKNLSNILLHDPILCRPFPILFLWERLFQQSLKRPKQR
jgi:hypothetical protein